MFGFYISKLTPSPVTRKSKQEIKERLLLATSQCSGKHPSKLKNSNRIIDQTPETAEIIGLVFSCYHPRTGKGQLNTIACGIGWEGLIMWSLMIVKTGNQERHPHSKNWTIFLFLFAQQPVPCKGIYCSMVTKPENPRLQSMKFFCYYESWDLAKALKGVRGLHWLRLISLVYRNF